MSSERQDAIAIVKHQLTAHKERVSEAIPPSLLKHFTPERLLNLAVSAMRGSERLQKCNPFTVCAAVVQAAVLGLEPNTPLGEAWILPFYNGKAKRYEAQLITGYRGWLKLLNNTGELRGIKAQIVRENDEFEFEDGIIPVLRHRYHHIKDRGAVIGYWAGVELKSGFQSIEYMSVKEAEEFRDRFAMTRDKDGKVYGVWLENPDEMALKTVIKKAINYIPKSSNNLALAVGLDNQATAGVSQTPPPGIPEEWQEQIQEAEFEEIPMPQEKEK